jgi:carbon monoxide dehydrogenase subunit G
MPLRALLFLLALLPAALGAAGQLHFDELEPEGLYHIRGSFESAQAPAQVFAVLSDYDQLTGVLSGLGASQVLERQGPRLKLRQRLVGGFLFFRRGIDLLLGVEEQAPWRIAFRQDGAKPFRRYEGAWSLEAVGPGTRVDYTLSVSRGDLAPAFVERRLFRENSARLLEELQFEVERRALLARP